MDKNGDADDMKQNYRQEDNPCFGFDAAKAFYKMDSSTERFSLVNTVELRLSQRMIFECLSDNQIIR
ncbi:hypothetical protein T4D_3721 [Trichinella pseudospiralis]|uniref:Uncharacterized protein n=1 Tax=Trichinella pseudospiralis TaxID=6337 RepID=A0A0V1FVQ1_TRIPS|nr:hypothetical protein T4D_3721 [Trichinella pseudospiralis]